MRNIIIYTISLITLISISFAQNIVEKKAVLQNTIPAQAKDTQNTYPICGTTQLIPQEQELINYYRTHPEQISKRNLAKPSFNFEVGDTKSWKASSWVTNEFYDVMSTCRAVGENCYVFVADSAWTEGFANQEAVNAIVEGFDTKTPNFNNKGIYDVDVETFGEPPNIDGDPKIIILILDIKDGWDGTGGYIAGYFSPGNQLPVANNPNSNEAEFFYMDCFPANILTANGRIGVLNTMAHEFQHLIHHRWDENEIAFPNEGLSEVASYVCGYGLRNDDRYRSDTDVYLFNWSNDDALPDYTRAALWTLYLYEQYPNGLLEMLVQEPDNGQDGIDGALTTYGANRKWQEVFDDWLIANYLQDKTVDPRWGYSYSNSQASEPVATHSTANAIGNGSVTRTSGQYVTFNGTIPDTITWTAGASQIMIKAIKIGDNTVVEDVPKSVPYIIKPNGETFTDVTFLIWSNSIFNGGNYSYEAKGSEGQVGPGEPGNYELAYEDGIPEGTLANYVQGDSIGVWFEGIAGGKLDSIKTIFSGSGRILLDVSGISSSSDFVRGMPLMPPLFKTVPESSNWYTYDLTSQNIDVSEDFIACYLLGADPYNPSITVSLEPDDESRFSLTYKIDDDAWYTYGDGSGNIWKYLIRAYVNVGGVTVAIDQSGIVTIPEEFSLEQNYPNPFNPTTTFNFATPKDGLVQFTVHDLLGRKIYSENRNLLAGSYSFTWDGQNNLNQQVVSGVYFLKMETDGFSKTRKMSLLR